MSKSKTSVNTSVIINEGVLVSRRTIKWVVLMILVSAFMWIAALVYYYHQTREYEKRIIYLEIELKMSKQNNNKTKGEQ